MRLRTLLRTGLAAAAVLLLTLPGGASARTEISQIICSDPGTYSTDPAPSGTSTTDVQPPSSAYRLTAYLPPGYGECGSYDWGVDPAYTGEYYSDDASAAAAEPPPPAPVTPALPTWRNLYDWAAGHGYVGWRTASVAQTGQYGVQGGLGGQYGLWLWPVGGDYSYEQGQYAEWFYPAPGTTRLSSATIEFTYRNKLLSHHCIDVGFRSGSTIIAHNEHCKPVQPPDSQRGTTLTVVDPSANPSSKELYIRIRVDCGGASTCSKHIPQHDPLVNGGFVRVTKVDMTLVDDDLPVVTPSGPFWDLGHDYTNGRRAYDLTIDATDEGAGITRSWLERVGSGTIVSSEAPCDPTHNTIALDNRICPQSYGFTSSIDTNPFPEGTNTFVAKSIDPAGNVGASESWPIYVDRTPPSVPAGLRIAAYDSDLQIATVTWDESTDPPLPDGVAGSGLQQYQVRYQINGGGFGGWLRTDDPSVDIGNISPGSTLDVEVQALDRVENVSASGIAHLVLPSSSTSRGPVLSGRVVDANGAGVQAGVDIYLLRPGDISPVGQATTEADGSFAIRLDPAAASDVADEAIRSGGWVNFDVVASDGTLVADATVGRKIMLAGWGDGEGPAPITVVLASGAEGVTSAGTSARRRLAARNRILAGFPICVTWNREKIADGIGWGVIGELHTGLDQTAKFSYGERADSNISVGVSADDIHYRGISGSVHIGTDKSDELSSEIGWRRGANFGYQLETTFKFEKWKYTRYCPISKKVEYRIIAKEWLPNQRTGKDVRSFDHHCLEKPLEYRFRGDKDGWFSRTNTSAYTYSAGVSVFGISLGIKSGYSKWVDSRWDFGHKYDAYWLCGDDGHPKKSHRIFAGG